MALWLRACTALSKNLSSDPSMHVRCITTTRNSYLDSLGTYPDLHISTYIHIKKKKQKKVLIIIIIFRIA